MTVIWNCLLNRQAEKSIAKSLSQEHKNMITAGCKPRPYRPKTDDGAVVGNVVIILAQRILLYYSENSYKILLFTNYKYQLK